MVYNIKGNENRYSCGYSSDFSIGCGCNTNYSYFFKSTNSLCSKPEFKFALSFAFYKL